MKTLVVGFGHPLRRDDGVGLWVAQRLEGMPGVEVVAAQALTPELIPKIATSDLVIFVDARVGSGPVCWTRIRPGVRPALIHALSPQGLLAWTEYLFGRVPESWLVTLPARDLSFGEGLSRKTRLAAEGLLSRIRTYLAERSEQ
ncbi:hydrogenase maturation protease [Candidatus Bipolaricaulota bacterium]|nr:hydrogenase maturation protease [Candidatus Bipolaricaulota bacterium]HDN19774.1 hydrogenase maturation protease [Candidatus Acetothermia bacterium]